MGDSLAGYISSKINYLGFKLTDLNFPLSNFKLEKYPYTVNITIGKSSV